MSIIKIINTIKFKNMSTQAISGLDGLRGFAVLFVLGAHTKFMSEGFGATGVWIFFLLSGYLLSSNLMNEYSKNNKSLFVSSIHFYIKRFFRIIPVYFIVLLFYCFIVWNGNMALLFKHYTFQEAIWLFWTIKTELLFYILLPILLISLSALSKNQKNLVFLSLLTIFIGYYITEYKILFTLSLAQLNDQRPFYVTPFLIGIFLAFMNLSLENRLRSFLFYISLVIVLVLTIDNSLTFEIRNLLYSDGIRLPWRDRPIVYLFVSILVLASIKSSFLILENKFIRTLGMVSFSFYLWHTLVLVLCRKFLNITGIELFSISFPIIFVFSIFSYYIIELPFHNIGRKLVNKIR